MERSNTEETAALLDSRSSSNVSTRRTLSARKAPSIVIFAPVVLAMMLVAFFFFYTKPSPSRLVPSPANHEVGRLPFMGYNTWNAYWCNIDEKLILETSKLLVSLGLADIGYKYMNVDDCYSEKKRNDTGDIVANKERFPSGMRALTDQIHDMGLKAGIYGDSGWYTCQYYPGSFQNEERDARLFREEWGFDLLKFDNCAVPFDDVIQEGMIGKFTRMSNAIKELAYKTGKPPMLFSLCQWGRLEPWLWARNLGQTWRTTDDIGANWPSIANIINQYIWICYAYMELIQQTRNSFNAWASDFYGHNDLDILEVGNGDLTYEESKTHFTVWALMKSPLLIGTDLASVTEETLSIFKNTEIIAINQDTVIGTGVTPFRWGINPNFSYNSTHPAQYWSGRSQNGTIFMLINALDEHADMFFSFTESPWTRSGAKYAVRDLWTHTDNGTHIRNFTAHAVPPHGVVALLLKDIGNEPAASEPRCAAYEPWSDNWCIDQNGTHVPWNKS